VNIGVWHGLWTLLILAVFVGIVAYVWSRRRRDHFERAGRIPLDDDEPGVEK
jgi:cytochrome c oxidase cbb3-type subunit 4